MFKFICSIACLLVVLDNAKPSSAQNNNLYLPPTEPGYDYPKPTQPPRGGPSPPKPPGGGADQPHEPGMPFDFEYSVNDIETANNYNHNAKSDGDVTRGEYRVQLPDGRTQVVRYTADWKNGYNADVSYE